MKRAVAISGVVLSLCFALLMGLYVSGALSGDRVSQKQQMSPSSERPGPDTKSGAELRVLESAGRLLQKTSTDFIDPVTGLLVTNTSAQCYPGITTKWVCELDSQYHPRPMAWFNVRGDTGAVALRGEQPLGFGYATASTTTVASGLTPSRANGAMINPRITLPDTR